MQPLDGSAKAGGLRCFLLQLPIEIPRDVLCDDTVVENDFVKPYEMRQHGHMSVRHAVSDGPARLISVEDCNTNAPPISKRAREGENVSEKPDPPRLGEGRGLRHVLISFAMGASDHYVR